MNRSLRTTIILFTISIVLLVGTGVCLSVGWYAHGQIRESHLHNGQAATRLIAESLVDDLYYLNVRNIRRRLREAAGGNPLINEAILTDAEGLVLGDTHTEDASVMRPLDDPFAVAARQGEDLVVRWEGSALRIHTPVRDPAGYLLGYLMVEFASESMTSRVRTLVVSVIGPTLLIMAVGLVLATILSRRVTQPIRALLDATQKISQHDLATRVHLRRRDELGRLGQAINRMAEELGLRDAELRQLNESLQGQVEQRTAALKDAKEQAELAAELARDSERRYALAARAVNDGLWEIDVCERSVYFAPRWKAIVGLEPHVADKSIDDWMALLHPDDREFFEDRLNQLMGGRVDQISHEHRIRHADGRYIWVLCRGANSRDDNGSVIRVAGSMSDVHERREALDRLEYAAWHDGLTGLPNRAAVKRSLDELISAQDQAAQRMFAVLFLDFDRFKRINDSLGHAVGDEFLRQVARRIAGVLDDMHSPGVLARLGGDEFTVLLESIASVDEAIRVAEQLGDKLAAPYRLGANEITTTASIGIACSDIGYARADDIIRDADTAMYRAKAQGRACYAVFDQAMHNEVREALELEGQLRGAQLSDELRLFYQPIVDLRTALLVGFEALLRWEHPRLGMVPPDRFIPMAEELGIILPIGDWVVDQAAGQLRAWWDRLGVQRPGYTTVNISKRQLMSEGLTDTLGAALDKYALPPTALRVEVTESDVMEEPELVASRLAAIKALGIPIYMDDFGTGLSSLERLQSFPLDGLKIDKAFVQNMSAGRSYAAIVHAATILAQNLDLTVVAEGVETPQELAALVAMDCDLGQGYYFAKPMPGDQAEQLLLQNNSFRCAPAA